MHKLKMRCLSEHDSHVKMNGVLNISLRTSCASTDVPGACYYLAPFNGSLLSFFQEGEN